MWLGNITYTEVVCTLSRLGLARVTQSIRDVGWLDQFALSVIILQEAVRDGEQLSAKSALKVAGRVLDVFSMRSYRYFVSPALERTIANCE